MRMERLLLTVRVREGGRRLRSRGRDRSQGGGGKQDKGEKPVRERGMTRVGGKETKRGIGRREGKKAKYVRAGEVSEGGRERVGG